MTLTIEDLSAIAETALNGRAEGAALDPLEASLIRFSVLVSCTLLADDALEPAIGKCFDNGAQVEQVTEMLAVSSGLGVHSLMAGARHLFDCAARRGLIAPRAPMTPDQSALWQKHVGDDPFWARFENELPGFLDALLRLSPDLFAGFFEYCAIPWKMGTVRARTKELAAMACDATPSHRFEPGFRVHLANAIDLGVSAAAIRETLKIAAELPAHGGYRSPAPRG